jgi:hypothetical protein
VTPPRQVDYHPNAPFEEYPTIDYFDAILSPLILSPVNASRPLLPAKSQFSGENGSNNDQWLRERAWNTPPTSAAPMPPIAPMAPTAPMARGLRQAAGDSAAAAEALSADSAAAAEALSAGSDSGQRLGSGGPAVWIVVEKDLESHEAPPPRFLISRFFRGGSPCCQTCAITTPPAPAPAPFWDHWDLLIPNISGHRWTADLTK